MLRVPFDSHRLYSGDDPDYELWLMGLADRVSATIAAEHAKMRTK
jgi:hypothetical protein